MDLLESVPEIMVGVGVEVLIFAVAASIAYRFLGGRFLLPKREIILPNQRGVLVQGDQVIRIAAPGSCWVRPKQRLVLIDARSKPLQMTALEVLGSDNAVVRLSLSAEYKVADAGLYYSNSANAADTLFVQLRRVLNVVARQKPGATMIAARQDFSSRVLDALAEPVQRLGLQIEHLDIYEAVPLGFLRTPEEPATDFPSSGLVH